MPEKCVLTVVGVRPKRIGGMEVFCRELTSQLAEHGCLSVLAFLSQPCERVRKFLDLPNVRLEILEETWKNGWQTARKLARLLREYRPTVVHFYFTDFVCIYPWLARVLSAQRVFFTDQTSIPYGCIARRAPVWKRLLVRQINHPLMKVFCASNFLCQHLVSTGLLHRSRFETLYNGVDLTRAELGRPRAIHVRRQFGIPVDRLMIMQVGQLIPEKGLCDFLEAAQRLLLRKRDLQFVIVGDGPYCRQYVQLARKLGIDDHVTFTGLVQDPIADGLYATSDIVCQVSRWEEAFGFTIAEAMSAGKPVIGTRVGAIPELISHGETGYLIERCDVNGLAECMALLAEDAGVRTAMGRAGAQRCAEKFNVIDKVRSLIAHYKLDNCH